MAAVYLFASIGIMPTPAMVANWLGRLVPASELAERYPCDDHACGCVTASECWLHCCCHTHQQRLNWAAAHGVRPPEAVRFSAAQWLAAVEAAKSDAGGAGRVCSASSDEEALKPVRGFSMSALACKGIQQILAVSVPPALPRRVGEMMIVPVIAQAIETPRASPPDSRSLDVPEPPPRLG